MNFANLLGNARRQMTGLEENPIQRMIEVLLTEFQQRGVTIGVTELVLSSMGEYLGRGFIADIDYHNHYGFHLVWVSASGDAGKNCFITSEAIAELTCIS